MCRPSNKNPNWKGGISKQNKTCLYCNQSYVGKSITIFCNAHCRNAQQWFDSLFRLRYTASALRLSIKLVRSRNKRKKAKPNSGVKVFVVRPDKPPKPRKTARVWECIKCKTIVNRRVKYCSNCLPKKEEINVVCRYCKKHVIKYKGQGNKFCNRECQLKSYVGKSNPNYIDGRTPENKRFRASLEYQEWRKSVFKRDNYTCLWCGKIGGVLHADHIKQFAFYPELRLNLDNGRTLCLECHKKTDTYMKGKKKIK